MRRRSLVVPGGLLAVTIAALALELAGERSAPRAALVSAFVLVAPGWAILRVWDLASGWAGVAGVLAVSIALATIVPGALLYAHAWSPTAAIVILAGVTLAGCVAGLIRSGREGDA